MTCLYHNNHTLTMTLMINTSEGCNSSKVQCHFDLNAISISGAEFKHKDSVYATLILIDGELYP